MNPFQSIHKTGFRLLKMIHAEDSIVIPMYLLDLVLSLGQIYIGLFLTAGLVDALLAGQYRQAAGAALMLLLANLFFGLASRLIIRRLQCLQRKIWLVFYVWLRRKAFSMDYETMEKPEVAEKLLFSERTSDMQGGLGTLLYHYYEILKAIVNLLLSVSLVAHLCLRKPGAGFGVLGALASPVPSALLLAGMMAGTVFGAYRAFRRFAEERRALFESHTGVEDRVMYLTQQVLGNFKAGKMIRIYGMQDMILENLSVFLKKSWGHFSDACDVERKQGNANRLVDSVFIVGAYLLAALKVVTGAVTVGAFTQYVGALHQFGGACFTLIAVHGDLQKICTYMEEFLAFLDTENLHVKGSIPVEKRTDGEYEIAFEHVSFRYPGTEKLVLKDVDCRIRVRGKLAVVGRNGAGKTTFIKLLCRLYEPASGRITLNGVDIRKYDEEEYRSLFGVVFQDFKLFAFPVWENVTAGRARNETRIWEVLEQAEAGSMVRGMPGGLDTYLYKDMGDGVEISGGEAQKLALARALYRDAPVVILDEPTAALDPKAEAEVYARFHEMVQGRTSVYISHRMASCRFCDDIIVFEDGKIVERGSHEALSAAGGSYAKMWSAQAKYYDAATDSPPEAPVCARS